MPIEQLSVCNMSIVQVSHNLSLLNHIDLNKHYTDTSQSHFPDPNFSFGKRLSTIPSEGSV